MILILPFVAHCRHPILDAVQNSTCAGQEDIIYPAIEKVIDMANYMHFSVHNLDPNGEFSSKNLETLLGLFFDRQKRPESRKKLQGELIFYAGSRNWEADVGG